jgi:hypothetical protein
MWSYPLPISIPISISRTSGRGFNTKIKGVYVWQEFFPRLEINSNYTPISSTIFSKQTGFRNEWLGVRHGSLWIYQANCHPDCFLSRR